jgi:hypothetical protein
MEYFEDDWLSLPWSPWVPFTADKHEFRQIPKEPGLYRIRPVGKDFLMYIGETRRTVHERVNELRHNIKRTDLMPWNDPHTAAPSLWAWQDAEGFEYECSATPLDASTNGRRGMESYLLYRYRQERGESTLCNFGRFHPRYRKSTNRKENLRGGKLESGQKDNPAGWTSIAPLEATGSPGDLDWMGLEWSAWLPLDPENARTVIPGAGLYLLADTASHEIAYIGQSVDVGKRLINHSRKSWNNKSLLFSYQIIAPYVFPHNLKELENDLIGNYFEQNKKAPEFQFSNCR